MEEQEKLLKRCRDRAFYAYGTARIFERRAQRLETRRNWITYLGIVVPVLVGSVALSFGKDWLPFVLLPAGLVTAVQLALSVWSLVARWDDRHSHAVRAVQDQTGLFNDWERLAQRTPADLEQQVAALDLEDQHLEQGDLAQAITLPDKRYAMRASLYHFGSECARCK
jgi:mobilome CxxCx(11)CxxC protein